MALSEPRSDGALGNARKAGAAILAVGFGAAGLAAIGVAAVGLSGALIGMSPIAAASNDVSGPSVPPGFCAAPDAVRESGALSARQGELPLLAFVSCQELREWRNGERERFEVAGAVSLTGAETTAEAVATGAADRPNLLAALSNETDGATVTQIMMVAARMAEAGVDSADLGLSVDNEVAYSATLLRQPSADGAERLQVRMSAQAARLSGPSTRREMIMPFESGDTLRYMRAMLRAGLAADGITRIAAAD